MNPRIGIIGGSGLGQILLRDLAGRRGCDETPFGPPAAAPVLADWNGVPIAFLPRHGHGHVFNPSNVPYRANVYALKASGCKWIIGSCACGSLNEAIAPRDLVVLDQAIDKTFLRKNTFFEDAVVHVEFAEPCCPRLRQLLLAAAQKRPDTQGSVHGHGTYLCMEGPSFSTRAESLLHRAWGADLIGMTLLPEARLAREAEISYACVALATDYDCWRPPHPDVERTALLAQIMSNLQAASENAAALIGAALPEIWNARDETFASHNALELAIWSDKKTIPAATRQRLDLLWGRHF